MLKGERSPDANFNELWLRQKMIQVFSKDKTVRQTCMDYAERLQKIILNKPPDDIQLPAPRWC
jgi:hypothetical protein